MQMQLQVQVARACRYRLTPIFMGNVGLWIFSCLCHLCVCASQEQDHDIYLQPCLDWRMPVRSAFVRCLPITLFWSGEASAVSRTGPRGFAGSCNLLLADGLVDTFGLDADHHADQAKSLAA